MTRRTVPETIDWLVVYAARELNVTDTNAETEIAELGADSLEAVTMVTALQKWLDCELCPTLMWDCVTLRDVAEIAVTGSIGTSDAQRAVSAATEIESSTHSYSKYVNPFLVRKLAKLDLDKEFTPGRGCDLFDTEGRRYLDFMAQYGALPFGHNPPEIWAAIALVQRDEEACFVQPSLLGAAGELARRLIAVAPPGLSNVTFTNSGTEAIEAAIKLCFQATGRRAILSTDGGFHGKTLGALSASGRVDYQTPFGLPLANFHRVPYGDLNALRVELEARRNHYAAFVVEPIQGEGGVIVPPPNYLREAKRLCTDQGVLLVVDEVQTGLGRTGYMFACEADQVTPDVLTLAKALGGGVVPIGAVLCSEQVFGEDFALKHSSTFAGNALASRAGLATMDLLERADRALLRQIQSHGAYLRDRLTEIQRRHPDFIEAISGRGFMLGIRFSVDRAQWREGFLGIVAEQNQIAQLVASYLLNVEGLRVAPTLNQGQVLRIQPPLNATRKQCAQAADAIDRCMAVLATGDTGRFFGSIFDRRARPAAAPLAHPARPPAPYVDTDARFGFLIHPLDAASFAEYQ